MGKPAVTSAEARDFPGLVVAADPRDFRPGAARDQKNLTSDRPGQLTQRPGLVPVVFEGE
jgi:hypothetical protein